MNGVRLLELALAVAPLMPSANCGSLAAMEWREARAKWLAALEDLNLTEEAARKLARDRRWSERSENIQ